MGVVKGHLTGDALAAHLAAESAPPAPSKVNVRLRQRSILEPGCITVDAGHVMDIPAAHYDPAFHELTDPLAAAPALASGPPAAAGAEQPPAVSDEDQADIRLFEDP